MKREPCYCHSITGILRRFSTFFVAQQPTAGPGRLVWTRKYDTHTHPVGLLCTSEQPVAQATTYTTHKKHKRRTSMSSAGFGPATSAIDRLYSHILYRRATESSNTSSLLAHLFNTHSTSEGFGDCVQHPGTVFS